jgi:diguanylate cyclase (GGDEF)-like protein
MSPAPVTILAICAPNSSRNIRITGTGKLAQFRRPVLWNCDQSVLGAEHWNMSLDLPTLMVMQSFAMACAGAILLFAWLQNRTKIVFAIWGIANFMAAAGILCLMFGFFLNVPIYSAVGGVLLSSQSSLAWKVARTIEAKRTPVVLLLGPLAIVLVGAVPATRNAAGIVALTIGAVYCSAAAITLWLGRREQVRARWPLLILTTVHALALFIGVYSSIRGSTGPGTVPALTSAFGFIYFESIIFAVGMSVFILAMIKERDEAAGRLAASLDPLTGIDNRSGFIGKAERVVERCRRAGAPMTVMMFDLDRFKRINDTHGHAVGDAVIRTFCTTAAAALRPNDVFGRLGGEEFAVVLPGSSIEAAYVRAERIRSAFAANGRFIGARHVDATVSCGLAVGVGGEQTLAELLEEADWALYDAKASGRNRVKRSGELRPGGGSSTVIRVA